MKIGQQLPELKVKPSTCIAPYMVKTTLKRSGMDHTVLPATNTMPALPRKRVMNECIVEQFFDSLCI